MAIAYFAIRYLLFFILPFIIGLIIAFTLQKPITWLSKKTKIHKKVSAIIFVLLLIAVSGGLLWLIAYLAACETGNLTDKISIWCRTTFPTIIDNVKSSFNNFIAGLPESISKPLNNVNEDIVKAATGLAGSLGEGIIKWSRNTIAGIPGFLIAFIITIVSTCFISMDYRSVVDFIRRQIPERHIATFNDIKCFFVTTVLKMGRAYLLIMLITCCELSLGFWILKIGHPILVGAIISVIDILPVLGTGSVIIPWAIISFFQSNWKMGFGLIILYVIVTIIRNIIEPKIVGDQIGLHPVVTLTAMYLGLKLFGLLGMFILPITILLLKRIQDTGKIRIWK